MTDLGLVGAFVGGVLAVVSPCSALLLPSFFAVAFAGVRRTTARVGAFTAGLLAVLVPLGAGVGAVGDLLTVHRHAATVTAGCVVAALGVLVAAGGGLRVPGVDAARGRLDLAGGGTWLATCALGALYGLSGFCSGPLLGAILAMGLVGGSGRGAALMGAYGLGMVVPLLLLALVWDRLGGRALRVLRGRPVRLGPLTTHSTSLLSGALLVAIGVVFVVTDGTTTLPGLTDNATELDLQQAVVDRFGAVPDAAALLLLAAAVLAVVAVRLLRR